MNRSEILSIAVSRLVPILFGLSFTLVAARVIADRASRRENVRWLVFVLVVVGLPSRHPLRGQIDGTGRG